MVQNIENNTSGVEKVLGRSRGLLERGLGEGIEGWVRVEGGSGRGRVEVTESLSGRGTSEVQVREEVLHVSTLIKLQYKKKRERIERGREKANIKKMKGKERKKKRK